MLLWLQRRAPTDHRTAATASLFFANVVKPMVLATFFVNLEARNSKDRLRVLLSARTPTVRDLFGEYLFVHILVFPTFVGVNSWDNLTKAGFPGMTLKHRSQCDRSWTEKSLSVLPPLRASLHQEICARLFEQPSILVRLMSRQFSVGYGGINTTPARDPKEEQQKLNWTAKMFSLKYKNGTSKAIGIIVVPQMVQLSQLLIPTLEKYNKCF